MHWVELIRSVLRQARDTGQEIRAHLEEGCASPNLPITQVLAILMLMQKEEVDLLQELYFLFTSLAIGFDGARR